MFPFSLYLYILSTYIHIYMYVAVFERSTLCTYVRSYRMYGMSGMDSMFCTVCKGCTGYTGYKVYVQYVRIHLSLST